MCDGLMAPDEHIDRTKRRVRWTGGIIFLIALGGIVKTAIAATAEPPPSLGDWLVGAVKDVGFPVAVAAFLLVRVERTLDDIAMGMKDQANAMKEQGLAIRDLIFHFKKE